MKVTNFEMEEQLSSLCYQNNFKDRTFDEERALYGIKDAVVENCNFAGPADGESALKECQNIIVKDSNFQLRYPFWHVTNANIDNINMTETCRAAMWYDNNMKITNSSLKGIKAIRECKHIVIDNCTINSQEFGWMCQDIEIKNTKIDTEYPFFHSNGLFLSNVTLCGKYSFQYVQNVNISNSTLNTKDMFWHSKNVTITDCVITGAYLAWYAENITFIRCKIIGTQPLCYVKGLVLEDCEMIDCDLSFERSENIFASINGFVTSIKNPINGKISADKIGEIILEFPSSCEINSKSLL
eukprot:TRINITY_DN1787_c0_g1_i1.p1 TRINITY_DN1787_c0_g1~~TRINITY_DN1787_c0_g1_i1.p1  ORF type:complete len:298 (-),score=75.08 TRINITY_DN1787_c0_g1_i1:276-1169(-)